MHKLKYLQQITQNMPRFNLQVQCYNVKSTLQNSGGYKFTVSTEWPKVVRGYIETVENQLTNNVYRARVAFLTNCGSSTEIVKNSNVYKIKNSIYKRFSEVYELSIKANYCWCYRLCDTLDNVEETELAEFMLSYE